MLVMMWLVVLSLVLAVGLHGVHTSPLDAYTLSLNTYSSTPDGYTSSSDTSTSPTDAYTSTLDAYTSKLDAYTSQSDTHIMPVSDPVCPAAKDIAPCMCTLRSDATMNLDCSNVASEGQLAQIFGKHFPFKNFYELIIYHNQNLKVLRPGVFGDVTFQRIQITSGQLVEVEEGALSGSFTTATTINISYNKIFKFPFIELERFSKLQDFYIHHNNIQDFPSLKSSTLSDIRFGSNPLTSLPATALRDLPNLSSCVFDHTGISQIKPGTFSGLPHLKFIYLYSNNIQHIPTGAIQLNDKITGARVYLDNNRINNIEIGAVTGVKQGRLSLKNNRLEELDEAVFKPMFDAGNNLILQRNPLKCGCIIAWLIPSQEYMDQLAGRCHDGVKLKDLDPKFYEQNCYTNPTLHKVY